MLAGVGTTWESADGCGSSSLCGCHPWLSLRAVNPAVSVLALPSSQLSAVSSFFQTAFSVLLHLHPAALWHARPSVIQSRLPSSIAAFLARS
eukprot:6185125-Pleurochrysis_carterae.AAC.3